MVGSFNINFISVIDFLMLASCFDHVEVVKQLIAAGANIEAKTKFRQTSLILGRFYSNI